jgi:excinuclease ABC subunit A
LRDILVSLGYQVDKPWRELPKRDRNWILCTEEQPTVPVYAGFTPAETRQALKRKMEPTYMGTFTSARKYVFETFAKTQSALMKKRVAQYMPSAVCPVCHGKRLPRESLSVKFAGLDIAEISGLSLKRLTDVLKPFDKPAPTGGKQPEKAIVTERIVCDLLQRLKVLLDLGLGYLSLDRSTPTLSPGELLRLAAQLHSNLFGVVYVLDEPSAGLHPADTEALLDALEALKQAGNSLFVVEHELEVIRRADWIVDVGQGAGEGGGEILYSGPPEGLRRVVALQTRQHLFRNGVGEVRAPRVPNGWLHLREVTKNNLHELDVDVPLGTFTSVTGVSGSGKSSLISQVLVDLVAEHLGQALSTEEENTDPLEEPAEGAIAGGTERIRRLVVVDQKPIGRTPRSNMATYTGLFDHVRRLFASTKLAKSRRYDAGRFSFNLGKGRCERCSGEGFVCVELLFLPSVYAPCPVCGGKRFNAKTLEVEYRGKNIADVLRMTVDQAAEFFAEDPLVSRALSVLQEVGLGYLRLGQPATELSGGERNGSNLRGAATCTTGRYALRTRRTDNRATPHRRGAVGAAVGWSGLRRKQRRGSGTRHARCRRERLGNRRGAGRWRGRRPHCRGRTACGDHAIHNQQDRTLSCSRTMSSWSSRLRFQLDAEHNLRSRPRILAIMHRRRGLQITISLINQRSANITAFGSRHPGRRRTAE